MMNEFAADMENLNGENTLTERAAAFAKAAHAGQTRKGTDIPYIVHPMAVLEIVSGVTDDETVLAAAVLHDTVEDTDTTRDDIEELFGRRVAELVASESENKREGLPEEETWKIRKQETLKHLAKADYDTQTICLGDKLANMRDIARDYAELGDELWVRFNAPEDGKSVVGKKANIGWYYRGIANRLRNKLGGTDAWKELDALVSEVFGVKSCAAAKTARAELVGFNKELEDAIKAFNEAGEDDEAGKAAMADIIGSAVKGFAGADQWYVPLVPCNQVDESMVSTELLPGKMFFSMDEGEGGYVMRTVAGEDGENSLFAFTSGDKVPGDGFSIGMSSRVIMEIFAEADAVDLLVLNPGEEPYWFEKEEARKILEIADNLDVTDVCGEMCYKMEPLAVIDTDRIIEGWSDSWQETFVNEEWKLHSYSVMPDGTVLVAFSMEDEVYETSKGEAVAVHTNTFFRVLQYRLGEDGPEVTGKFRFKLQDGSVKKVFVSDGMLFAAVSRDGAAKTTVLQLFPNDDDEQFGIGEYVRDLVQRSSGELFVSYYDAQNVNRKNLVTVFDAESEKKERYYGKDIVSCRAMTMDADESIWYHSYPSNAITEIGADNEFGERHWVALQGFKAFALSDDRSRLVAEFSEYNDESVICVMHQDRDGDYGVPIRFAFEPEDENGEEILSENCRYFGCPAVCKSTMILRADGKLYWYDVNGFCD